VFQSAKKEKSFTNTFNGGKKVDLQDESKSLNHYLRNKIVGLTVAGSTVRQSQHLRDAPQEAPLLSATN
jgi:hypothetical protein